MRPTPMRLNLIRPNRLRPNRTHPAPTGVTAELRFVPEVRSVDFERTRRPPGRTVLYVGQYADLDPRSLGADARRVSAWTAWTWAFRGRRRVVELPEPLWLRALPFTYSVGLAFRLADLLRRHRTLIVTYAMENNAPERLFRPLPAVGRRALAALIRGVGGVVYDRIAFASPAAAACYRDSRVLPGSVATREFLELLPRCTCAPPNHTDADGTDPHRIDPARSAPDRRGRVVFLGALEPRKGVPDLLAAWELVPAAQHGWSLALAGAGRCADEVRRAALANPTIDHIGLAGRESVHVILRAAAVLVLPSRREGRWCEQIGLPVVEGLAHGCRIVATSDTGLAPWLREHGHVVLPEHFTTRQLADALTTTLGDPGVPSGPGDDPLPTTDARILAEDWMRAVDHSCAARTPSDPPHDALPRKDGT